MKKSKSFISLCEKYEVDAEQIPEITSFETACKALGIDPTQLPVVDHLPARHQKRLLADYKLCVIADALRQGEDVDYFNRSTYKYHPVFVVEATKEKRSGVGLSCDGYVDRVSLSDVGVRLCFRNPNVAEFFGKHFIELHTDHHLLT